MFSYNFEEQRKLVKKYKGWLLYCLISLLGKWSKKMFYEGDLMV